MTSEQTGHNSTMNEASSVEPLVYHHAHITRWDKLVARFTTPLVRNHIASLWKELDSARFHLSWYTNGNAEMQRHHYRDQVNKLEREVADHKEHISRLRHLLWSAEQELKAVKGDD